MLSRRTPSRVPHPCRKVAIVLAFNPPWIEGEKIPDEHIRSIFQQPPGVPISFYRSSLLVGSRGVGKTTLFRYQKEIHDGIAIHISLNTEFASLTKQTGFGPLAFDIPADIEPLIIGKATSLLAVSLAERLLKKGMTIPREPLLDCLPVKLRPNSQAIDTDNIGEVKRQVSRAVAERFDGISETQALPYFVSALGEACQRIRGPLLLLLDRADMVIAASLVPVIQLLDQSSQFVALVAMRPGPVGQAVANLNSVPGDHYSVVHLGMHPRSEGWSEFVEGAVRAQIGEPFSLIPKAVRTGVISISRDSLRTALELFSRYLSAGNESPEEELNAALEDLKENQLAAAQKTLQKYHPNFRRMIVELRNETIGQYGSIDRPVVISIRKRPKNDLFESGGRASRFIDEALRSGAFCIPEGTRWTPGLRPTEVEIQPILLWQEGDSMWTVSRSQPYELVKGENEMFTSLGGPRNFPSIFIAYRMRIDESKRFRRDIEKAIRSHPDLSQLKITDGHVPAGAQWATSIRSRIKNAKAVIGDVTGMSPEVLFELGFAFGLTKTIIPAISVSSDITKVPRWLGATQLGSFGSSTGIMGLLSSISSHLSDPEFSKPLRPAVPIPSLAVWLRELGWNNHALEQFKAAAIREGLKTEVFGDVDLDETIIRRASSASLLIVSLDGTEGDAFMHFVCGAVAAKPKAGTGSTLSRLILVLEEPTRRRYSYVAESLRRCQDTVRVVQLEDIRAVTEHFGKNYNRWAVTAPKKGRKK
jgi:hypothetical protein